MGFHALDRIVVSRRLGRAGISVPAARPFWARFGLGEIRAKRRFVEPGGTSSYPGLGPRFLTLPPLRDARVVTPEQPALPASAPRPLVLGVLGGIAAGKSAVARLLAGAKGLVLSADSIAHEVLDSPEVLERVRALFGPEAITPDGHADRAVLAARAFGPDGSALRAELESWTHPRVRDRIRERLDQARASGVSRIVLDVPLLLENDAQHGLAGACDVLVFVDVPDDERDRRAREARGWRPGEVARREAFQMPLEEKKRRAQHVIPNTQSLQDLEAHIARLLPRLNLH